MSDITGCAIGSTIGGLVLDAITGSSRILPTRSIWSACGKARCEMPDDCEDYTVDCCNEDCGWTGLKSETVHHKHDTAMLLCPECHETTEPVADHIDEE